MIQFCGIIISQNMRNIFLCFFALFLFAPEMAGAAGRTVQKNDSNTDSARVTNSVRTTASRATTNTASRTKSTQTGRTSDAQSRNIATRTNTNATVSRTATIAPRQSTVVSRMAEKIRNNISAPQSRITQTNMSRIIPARGVNTDDRSVANRAATIKINTKTNTKPVSAADVSAAKDLLEQTASLNKSCQEQYNECMDQFCAVVDANQKRCSCSANLSKYASVQDAVTRANDELNTVAQRIRYVGLSADEIRAIMSETEAEAELDGTRDTSETRSMLSKIESLIKDPTTHTTNVGDNDDFFGLDIDLDFTDENNADIFSLDFLNNENDSISSKRGTALYNAAKRRCKTILNNCTDVGATTNQITGNYDLAIDKDCIAYEQGLKKMNQTLQSNVRSAGLMLQKARLAVLQNKNQYDAKGCIGALESCMTDDMVCGSDYAKCLDPTKKYIDENGSVVLGTDITNITDFMENFNNAAINGEKLASATSVTMNEDSCKSASNNDGTCVIKYLLTKIGTGATVKDGGLCRAVLDKCQQYTYNASGDKYNPYNDIVVNYVQRAMVNIKSSQQQIISNYASSCMTDVAACYNQQVTQVNSWSSVASVSSIKGVMTGACRNVALTCAYAVFANMCSVGEQNAINWVLQGETPTTTANNQECVPCDSTSAENQSRCIEGISEIFYQSLLCPENSTYSSTCSTANASTGNRAIGGCVNTQCTCNAGYTSWNGSCVESCGASEYRNAYGLCLTCDAGLVPSGASATTEAAFCSTSSGSGSGTGGENNTCPANADANTTCTAAESDGGATGCVSVGCMCQTGFDADNGSCVASGGTGGNTNICPANSYADTACTAYAGDNLSGACVSSGCKCSYGYYTSGGECVDVSTASCAAYPNSRPTAICTAGRSNDGTDEGCVSSLCKCNDGYAVSGNSCVSYCPTDSVYDSACTTTSISSGCVRYHCRCSDTTVPDGNGHCVAPTSTTCPDYSYSDNTCTEASPDGTSRGCVLAGCRCNSGFQNVVIPAFGGTSIQFCSPTNSTRDTSCTAPSPNGRKDGCVMANFKCNTGFTVWNSTCKITCSSNQYRNSNGVCTSCIGTLSISNPSQRPADYEYDTCIAGTAGGGDTPEVPLDPTFP